MTDHDPKITIFADEEIQAELELRKKIYKNATGGYRNNSEIIVDMIHEIKELKQISSEKSAKIAYLADVEIAEKLKKIRDWVQEKTAKMGQQLVVDYDLIFGYKKENEKLTK
jgi:hypothetical protein